MESLPALAKFGLWLHELISHKKNRDDDKKIEYIDHIISLMKQIVKADPPFDQAVANARGELQAHYNGLAYTLEGLATLTEFKIIRMSIMATRVYYHAAQYGRVVHEEESSLKDQYEERIRAYLDYELDQESFRQSSYEPIIKGLVKDGDVIPENRRQRVLSSIAEICHEDMHRISLLRHHIKNRRIFVIAPKGS